jgi:hypothetical protein
VTTPGYREAVAAVFKAHPRKWLPSHRFYTAGGRDGWRTRISECRLELGMNIRPNKTISVRRSDGTLKYRLSLYCYVPPAVDATPVQGHDDNSWGLR